MADPLPNIVLSTSESSDTIKTSLPLQSHSNTVTNGQSKIVNSNSFVSFNGSAISPAGIPRNFLVQGTRPSMQRGVVFPNGIVRINPNQRIVLPPNQVVRAVRPSSIAATKYAVSNVTCTNDHRALPANVIRSVPARQALTTNGEIIMCKKFIENVLRSSSQQGNPQKREAIAQEIKLFLACKLTSEAFLLRLEKLLGGMEHSELHQSLDRGLQSLRSAVHAGKISIDGINVASFASRNTTVVHMAPPGANVHPGQKVHYVRKLVNGQYAVVGPQPAQPKAPVPHTGTTITVEQLKALLGMKCQPTVVAVSTELFHCTALLHYIRDKVLACGIHKCQLQETVKLVKAKCRQRLHHILVQAIIAAEHRVDTYKVDSRYSLAADTKCKLQFLTNLDALEQKCHMEREKIVMEQILKSRSNGVDSHQQMLKQKAKRKQEALEEERLYQIANSTALAAIGPRKRTYQQISTAVNTSSANLPHMSMMQLRYKTVNLRDLQNVCERDQHLCKSPLLYFSHNRSKP